MANAEGIEIDDASKQELKERFRPCPHIQKCPQRDAIAPSRRVASHGSIEADVLAELPSRATPALTVL
jgi:hypothetical protein